MISMLVASAPRASGYFNTDWVEDVMENAYPALQKKAPKLLALLSQLLSAQRTTQDKIGDVLDDESKRGQLLCVCIRWHTNKP